MSDVCIFFIGIDKLDWKDRCVFICCLVIQNRHEKKYISANESLVFISTSQSRTRKPIFRISLTQNVVGAREWNTPE